jgi:hypothetical protein
MWGAVNQMQIGGENSWKNLLFSPKEHFGPFEKESGWLSEGTGSACTSRNQSLTVSQGTNVGIQCPFASFVPNQSEAILLL